MDDATQAADPGNGTVSVSGPDGKRLASLDIVLTWGAACSADGCDKFAADYLGDWAGQTPLSRSGPFVVRSMAVDLSDFPQDRERSGWTDNVRMVTSLSSNTGAPPSSLVPALMYGIGLVEAEAAAGNGDSQRVVLFISNRDFGTLREARTYAGSEQHRKIQAMIASFRER